MPSWGVDYGGQANLFNVGQSAGQSLGSLFSGATELKRATAEANINRVNARTRLDDQEYDARNGLGQANYDSWVKAHPQGASNANPSGAAPVVVEDPNAQRARYGGVLATSANDAATAYNTQTGGYLVQNGGPNEMRRGAALMGHLPTNNTVLGPDDTVGTDATIRIDQAKEQAKADAEQSTLGPYANGPFGKSGVMDNIIFSINEKIQKGEKLTPAEENLRTIAESDKKVNETSKIVNPDKTETYYTRPGPNTPFIEPTSPNGSNPPAVVPPTAPPATPSVSPPAPAPVIITPPGQPPAPLDLTSPTATTAPTAPIASPAAKSVTIGTPQPPELTGDQSNTNIYASEALKAEAILRQFDGTQIPNAIESSIASLANSSATASQFAASLDPASQMYFDSAFLFLTGKLRKESGAKVEMSEVATRWNQYMSRPGEPQEVTEWKRYIRTNWIQNMLSGVPQSTRAEREKEAQDLGVDLHYQAKPPNIKTLQSGAPTTRRKPVITGVEEVFD